MDLEDFLVSYNILPLGSLVYVLFCVRKNGWGWEKFLAEVNEGTGLKLPGWLRGYMAYVVPTLICLIYSRLLRYVCRKGNGNAYRLDGVRCAAPGGDLLGVFFCGEKACSKGGNQKQVTCG